MGGAGRVASIWWVPTYPSPLSLVRCFALNWFPVCGKLPKRTNGGQEEARLGAGVGLESG